MSARIVALVVLVVLVVLVACLLGAGPAAGLVLGGAARPRPPSPHVVVDTLNITHWRTGKAQIAADDIVETIDATAEGLRRRFPGRVMYVVKDRDGTFNDEKTRERYGEAARRNRVYVYIAERYEDPPEGVAASAEHSAGGRDDFYQALLAARWRCRVLTNDRLRDFARFRDTIRPFHVWEYAFARDLPQRDFVRPDSPAYTRLRKPYAIRPCAGEASTDAEYSVPKI